MALFNFLKKTNNSDSPTNTDSPIRVGGVGEHTSYEASTRTNLPLNEYMTRMMAQELPILDSTSRRAVTDILKNYTGPEITSVEELPKEIRDIMELY